MKSVLCFGDSNTHGADPAGGGRFDRSTRWTGVLQGLLGTEWHVIEEGCGGRTTVWEDPIEGSKNGATYLAPCLHSHKPLDLVVLLLGTNDLKQRFGQGPEDIARGAGALVDLCHASRSGHGERAPEVLLLAPPPLAPLSGTIFERMFAGAEEKSHLLGAHYETISREKGCRFLDLSGVVKSSPIDGIHWEAAEHAALARKLAPLIQSL
jgi:lysophospholipase L1-like esterase